MQHQNVTKQTQLTIGIVTLFESNATFYSNEKENKRMLHTASTKTLTLRTKQFKTSFSIDKTTFLYTRLYPRIIF